MGRARRHARTCARALAAAAAAAAALAAAPPLARADLRLWEEGADAPAPHRFYAVTAFIQPGFIWRADDPNSPATDDNFWLQRARFGFKALPFRSVYVRLELETTPSPVLTDAYVEWRIHEALVVRGGQFQLAFLRTFQFNEANLAFIDRTLYVPAAPDRPALRYLSPRDIGLMVTGRVGRTDPDGRSPVLEYWAGAFLGRGPNQIRNDDDAFLFSARLQLHVLGIAEGLEAESDLARNWYPHVSVAAAAYTNCDDRGQWNRGFTADAELRWQGLFASATFVWFRNGASSGLGDVLGYGPGCPGVAGAVDHIAAGASVQLQYVLPTMLVPAGAGDWEILARWDHVAPAGPADGSFFGGGPTTPGYVPPPSYSDTDNPPTRWRLTFGVNWFPTHTQTLRLSINYQLNRELEHVILAGTEYQGILNDVFWLQLTVGI